MKPGGRTSRSMFIRLLLRAALHQKGTLLAALLSVLVAAAATTAILNLFAASAATLEQEFRGFGANLVVEKNERSFSPAELEKLRTIVGRRGLAVPFAYAVARTQEDQPIVLAGVDFAGVARLNPWWSVTNWPSARGEALVGARARSLLTSENAPFTLLYRGQQIRLSPAGVVKTGADEDSRVYVSLEDFASLTGIQPSVMEIAAYGSAAQVRTLVSELESALPDAEVRVVRQITEGDAHILTKTRSTLLASALFIASTAALCMVATLMGWAFDRRRDFAIMKALGASARLVEGFVAAEAALIGGVGAVLGFAAGLALAAWIGRVNFHASIEPRLSLFPPVLAASVAFTLLASLFPLRLLGQIQPAMILKGE